MYNLKFDKYKSYQAIKMMEKKEQVFFSLDSDFFTNKTSFFLIRKNFLLLFLLFVSIVNEENNDF